MARLVLYPHEYPTRQRRNQLIMHHMATLILLMRCDEYQFRDFMMLEWSTLLIMMNKLFKLGGQFRNFTIFTWVFLRILYLPIMIGTYIEQVTYIQQCAVILIFMLGLSWTYEYTGFTIAPLICTSVASFAPILLYADGLIFHHALILVLCAVAHNTWYQIGNQWHTLYWIISNSFVFHAFYNSPTAISAFCHVMVGMCDYLDEDRCIPRDWNNLEKSYIRIAMNLWFGLGVYYSLM